jgi:hypothetical protein
LTKSMMMENPFCSFIISAHSLPLFPWKTQTSSKFWF